MNGLMCNHRKPSDLDMVIEEYDGLITYCPQLGGEVTFRYCRIVNEKLPCRNIVGCWNARIDVSDFLKSYSLEQLQRAFAHLPRTRLETMLELAEKGKKVIGKEEVKGETGK